MAILRKIGKILGIAVNVLLIAILLCNVYVIIARRAFGRENPTVFGFASAVVVTDSMAGDREDSFRGNDMIFTVRQDSYEIDDVIMFESDIGTVTHRVVGIEEEGYVTKGDANNTEDDERVKDENVVGKVFLIIPGVGVAIKWLTQPVGLMVIGIILVILVAVPVLFGKEEE